MTSVTRAHNTSDLPVVEQVLQSRFLQFERIERLHGVQVLMSSHLFVVKRDMACVGVIIGWVSTEKDTTQSKKVHLHFKGLPGTTATTAEL